MTNVAGWKQCEAKDYITRGRCELGAGHLGYHAVIGKDRKLESFSLPRPVSTFAEGAPE